MKKIISILMVMFLLVGCSNKNYIKQVDHSNSKLKYNYEISIDYKTLIIKTYQLKDNHWQLDQTKEYKEKDVKNQLGIQFDSNDLLNIQLGDYTTDQDILMFSYPTHMETYNKAVPAIRDQINVHDNKENPFMVYWAFDSNTKYKVESKDDTLTDDFLKEKVDADGGFLITLTFK